MSKVVLGKGLEALIPGGGMNDAAEGKYRLIPVEKIVPNPMQPRRDFDTDTLKQLSDSLRTNGMLQPLVVTKTDQGYTVVAGERRLRAARMAGMEKVPVVLMDELDETRMLELALVENLQREDLNPVEMAEAYHTLVQRCGLTQNDLAVKVGKSRAAVANILRLLGLPDEIKKMLRQGKLTEGHARAILAVVTEEQMLALAHQIVADAMSVRDAEREATKKRPRSVRSMVRDPVLIDTETFLQRLLGTAVRIHRGKKKGRIEIEYYGDQDLDRLLELLGKIASL